MKIKPEFEIELINEALKDIDTVLSLIPAIDMRASSLNRYMMYSRYLKSNYTAIYGLAIQLRDYKLDLEKDK